MWAQDGLGEKGLPGLAGEIGRPWGSGDGQKKLLDAWRKGIARDDA